MAQWFEVEDNLTKEQEKQRQRDYFDTFYGTENRRGVFSDVCFMIENLIVNDEAGSIKKNALRDLIKQIKTAAGLNVYKDVIDAEGIGIAKRIT
jgi:hypothetical protein